MGIREYVESNEKTHKKGKSIKYIFCEGKNSNQLIVNFPGFAKAHELPQYNYIRTLKNCNCNRLFILDDYGPRGSYLIGESGDSSIEEGVISLIKDICEKYRIKREEVITNGTSKGGFCALYYGIKYNFGYVIAGSPQTKLGDYLCFFPEIADYISGGHEPKDISYLNSLIYNLVEDKEEFPEIYIHVGEGDHHYKNHIIPFFNELDKKDVTYNLELRNYFTHSLIGNYYIEYLLKTLNSIDESIVDPKTPEIVSTLIQSSGNHLEVFCGANGDDLEYSVELFSLNRLVEKTSYQNSPKFMYPVSTSGKYHAKIYVKDDTSYNSSLTDEIEIEIDANLRGIENADKSRSNNFLGKKFNSLKSKIGSSHLNFFNNKKSVDEINPLHELKIEKVSSNSYKFTIQQNRDVESFAWYILLNGERVDTIWYRQENYLEYTFKEPGNYQIKYFVKDENSKLMYLSEPILLDKLDIK